jgi:Domain of unknown function (DUF4407)
MTESDSRYGKSRRKPGFLILVSGARQEVLDRCPSERIKFQSLGWAILITCCMATVSMWFALTSAMGFSPVLSLPIAILWGLIIMGIDRWLVTSMPLDGKRKLLVAAPRLALALLLGSLISTPIVLRIFESEINNQVSVIKENNEAAFLSSQQSSAVQARVTKWQKTVTNLEQVIDSKGVQAINPASDPDVQGLSTQLTSERTVAIADYKAWQCQLYGGCGAPKGSGPLAAASQRRYEGDEAEITKLTSEIQTREQSLQDTSASSQASRLQQAQSQLPSAQAELNAAQGEENSLLSNFTGTNNAANGLLIRLKALDQLSAGNSTLQTARVLLFLLFLVIEILPVTVKLLQPKGNYEKILLQEVEQELAKADWDMRADFAEPTGFRPSGDPRTGKPDGSGAGWPTQVLQQDQIEAELAAVWEQHSKAEPVHDWDGAADSDFLLAEDEGTGPQRLDDLLRGMPDTRSTSGYEDRQGGIERRYGDEEL